MSVTSIRDAGSTTPLQRAQALGPAIAAAADAIDEARELPPALARELAEAGMFRLLVPTSLGGSELPLPEYVRVVEAIARADASTGWCVNQGSVFATVSAYLDRAAAESIWSDPCVALSNGPSPTAEAHRVEGGYRVTGRWTYSSGCRHATWLAGLCKVYEDGEPLERGSGAPVLRHMIFPKQAASFSDVWQVRGLRGTGSHSFSVEDLYVPAECTVWNYGDPVHEDGPIYHVPMVLAFACGFASVAVGVARGAIDALLEMADTKVPRGAPSPLGDSELVRTELARAEAIQRSARAYLHTTVADTWESILAKDGIDMDDRSALRLATTHAIRLSAEAVDVVYTLAGTDAIYDNHPIQRRFQDVHVITQHVQGRLAHYENVGRHLVGGKVDKMWL